MAGLRSAEASDAVIDLGRPLSWREIGQKMKIIQHFTYPNIPQHNKAQFSNRVAKWA
jgi:hypothetical protein